MLTVKGTLGEHIAKAALRAVQIADQKGLFQVSEY